MIVKSWSPSALEAYETCPLRMKLERIDKLCPMCFDGQLVGFETQTCKGCGATREQAPPLVRGTALHKACEQYITGRETELPQELASVKNYLEELAAAYKARKVRVEVELALDAKWTPVQWFAKNAWLRAKLDVLDMREDTWKVVDWKTGRYKPDDKDKYAEQLEVYATAVLSAYGELVKSVETSLVFVDHSNPFAVPSQTITEGDLSAAQKRWAKRVKPLFAEEDFAPRPGPYCRWCDFSANKGGPCEF